MSAQEIIKKNKHLAACLTEMGCWQEVEDVMKDYVRSLIPTDQELNDELTIEEELGANYVIGTILARMDEIKNA